MNVTSTKEPVRTSYDPSDHVEAAVAAMTDQSPVKKPAPEK